MTTNFSTHSKSVINHLWLQKRYNYSVSDSNSDFDSNSVSDSNSDSESEFTVYKFGHLYFLKACICILQNKPVDNSFFSILITESIVMQVMQV